MPNIININTPEFRTLEGALMNPHYKLRVLNIFLGMNDELSGN
jgi:hypothetical protein